MKKKLITILCFLAIGITYGQSISQHIASSSGGYASNGNIKLHWSIGELAILSHKDEVRLTEGFYQPHLLNILDTASPSLFDLKLFPNPVSNNLSIKSSKILSYRIYSMNGVKVFSGQISEPIADIAVGQLIEGSYIIQFTDQNGHSEHRKFIKIYQ